MKKGPAAAPSSFSLTGTIGLSESSSSLAAEEPYSVHPAFQFDGEIETTNLRLREAAKLGFNRAFIPASAADGVKGIAVSGFRTLAQLVDQMLGRG